MTRNAALIAATLLIVATVAVPLLVTHWTLWARATWRITAFVALTLLVQTAFGSPFAPHYQAAEAANQLWQQAIEIAWWIIAAQGAIGFVRLFLVFETRPRETRIMSDLLAGMIYVATLLAIVDVVFQVPIGGVLATSGVIAIVLGLALQSSLADVFSGIAVGIERPYSPGDLLWIEGGIEGRVSQINWRSTHVATLNGDIAIIPNSVMAKSRLINHSLPTTRRGISVTIRLDTREPPARCLATLTAATKTCMLLEPDPVPTIARTELLGDGAVYEIGFSVESGAVIQAARTELLGHVQSHLRHAGIALAVPGLATIPSILSPSPTDILGESDWFGLLSPDDRTLLASYLTEIFVALGDTLIRVDDEPTALFIIASGAVEISAGPAAATAPIYRLGPGGSLGAIGLITGRPYAATATALTPVTAYRLDKAAICAAMAQRPDLVTKLQTLARQGRALQHSDVIAPEAARLEPSHVFLTNLHSFLEKLSQPAPP